MAERDTTAERQDRAKTAQSTVRLPLTLATVLFACSAPQPLPTTTAARPPEDTKPSDPVPAAPSQNEVEEQGRCGSGPGTSPDRSGDALASEVGVRGITGSLSEYDVEHAMEARHAALLACAQRRPRALGYVAGTIAFHMEISGAGKVERVVVSESDLGYPALEECLAAVVAATQFPAPAGARCAAADWHLTVDPLRRAAEAIEQDALEPVLERNAEATYEQCELERSRRFFVTGYVARRHKLRPLSVRATRNGAESVSDIERACLSSALEQWKGWPKARGVAKVSFDLHWLAAPKPTKPRAVRGGGRRSLQGR